MEVACNILGYRCYRMRTIHWQLLTHSPLAHPVDFIFSFFFSCQNLDSKIHHNNLLNNILAKVYPLLLTKILHLVIIPKYFDRIVIAGLSTIGTRIVAELITNPDG